MSYSDNAYIYLRKKILDWQWYNDTPTRSVFIHCLLRASWKETEYKGFKYGRGQLIDSNETMARDLGISIQNVKTAIKHLIGSGELTSLKVGNKRIITVVKYDMYQQTNLSANLELTSSQPQTNLELTSYKEYKEIKEDKEVKKKDLLNISDDIFNRPSDTDKKHESPYQEYLDLWNSLKSYGIAPLRAISEQRAKLLKPRLEMYGKDSFAECIEQIKQSDFLQGKHGGKPWTITFDWMIKPSNYPKVLEGNYRNKNDSGGNNQQGYLSDIMQMIGGD